MKNISSFALRVEDESLFLLDQTLIPFEKKWLKIDSLEIMIKAIKTLQVRGAPMIGLSASLFLALYSKDKNIQDIQLAAKKLLASRPTAVNLEKNMNHLLNCEKLSYETLCEKAWLLYQEDISLCEKIAQNSLHLFKNNQNWITICNTGSLATAGIGTALGCLKKAHLKFNNLHVYVLETRPLLQGARLTAWELSQEKIFHTLICDSMAAHIMQNNKIDGIIVGADRVCANGDFANKIGTYNLAVLANYFKIPFYIAAPETTLDPDCPTGKSIPIEQRDAKEVQGVSFFNKSFQWANPNSACLNPSFDVTPSELVTGYITNLGFTSSFSLKSST